MGDVVPLRPSRKPVAYDPMAEEIAQLMDTFTRVIGHRRAHLKTIWAETGEFCLGSQYFVVATFRDATSASGISPPLWETLARYDDPELARIAASAAADHFGVPYTDHIAPTPGAA